MLERAGHEVALTEWGAEVLAQCAPIAAALDAAHGNQLYSDSLAAATHGLQNPESLPSARVLAAMASDHDNSFVQFVRSRSEKARDAIEALPFSSEQKAHFEALSQQSLEDQKKIEGADTMPFEVYRQQYVAAERLGIPKRHMAAV
jgi:glutamate--cysteine ligase